MPLARIGIVILIVIVVISKGRSARVGYVPTRTGGGPGHHDSERAGQLRLRPGLSGDSDGHRQSWVTSESSRLGTWVDPQAEGHVP